MKMNYRIIVSPIMTDDGEEWIATYPDLKGCVGGGKTPQEAIKMAEEEKEFYLEALEAMGEKIPEPQKNNYSGKISLRIPKYLHKKLAEQAENEGVSINSYLQTIISLYVGNREYEGKIEEKFDRLEQISRTGAVCSASSLGILQKVNDQWTQCKY